MKYFLCALLGLGTLGLDQWVKGWTVSHFAAPAPDVLYATADPAKALIPGVVELTRVHNYGAAWSSFSGMRWLLIAVTSLIVLAVAWALLRRVVRHPLGVAAGCLIISGGLGNILDRVRLGYVVDMFHLTLWPSYPVFNVADICIVGGAVLGAVYYLWFYEKYDKKGISHGNPDAASQS